MAQSRGYQRDWQWEMATKKRSLQWEGFGDPAGPALLIAVWVQASGLGVGKGDTCSSPGPKDLLACLPVLSCMLEGPGQGLG